MDVQKRSGLFYRLLAPSLAILMAVTPLWVYMASDAQAVEKKGPCVVGSPSGVIDDTSTTCDTSKAPDICTGTYYAYCYTASCSDTNEASCSQTTTCETFTIYYAKEYAGYWNAFGCIVSAGVSVACAVCALVTGAACLLTEWTVAGMLTCLAAVGCGACAGAMWPDACCYYNCVSNNVVYAGSKPYCI